MNANPEGPSSCTQPPAWRGWALFLLAMAGTFALGALGMSILQRREEARPRPPLREIAQWETDNAKWGENFPRQYDTYKQMARTDVHTRYGGSFQRDYLGETPANVILFAGYGFSKEYKQARGHVYAVEDVSHTGRLSSKTPATCWTCKSPDVPRLMNEMGVDKFYASKFTDLTDQVKHPIGCLDCHEPNTMRLRITRPALREAFKAMGRDIDQVSHQEMRSLVCAQCHVEYHFEGPGNYLTFSWGKGLRPDDMDAYFEASDFSDWTHAISKTRMIKMQHPDYEVYTAGIHAYRNVACTDCHMPYRTEGGVKFTDHHLQSPLANIANSCAVCHRWSEDEVRNRVYAIQDKVHDGRARAEKAIAQAHFDIAAAMQAGADDKELTSVRSLVRKSQMWWDYVAANNGMGFHAPQECQRTLATSLDLAGQCRVECARILARHGVTTPVVYPDYGNKKKAQALLQTIADGKMPDLIEKKAK